VFKKLVSEAITVMFNVHVKNVKQNKIKEKMLDDFDTATM
jgi:hypothetical protein